MDKINIFYIIHHIAYIIYEHRQIYQIFILHNHHIYIQLLYRFHNIFDVQPLKLYHLYKIGYHMYDNQFYIVVNKSFVIRFNALIHI